MAFSWFSISAALTIPNLGRPCRNTVHISGFLSKDRRKYTTFGPKKRNTKGCPLKLYSNARFLYLRRPQNGPQSGPSMTFRMFCDPFRRAFCDDLAAGIPRFWSHVQDPIRALYHL